LSTLITIGTRGSALALWQAHHVEALLQAAGFATEIVTYTTQGDKILDRSLAKIGSKGVFTQELEDDLLTGRLTIAVHSAKDLQSTLPAGLTIGAFLEREKPVDVVVSFDKHFRLTNGPAIVGTSSTRRRALLARHYPAITAVEARGNLQTRLRKLETNDSGMQALVLAYAGVHRMGWNELIVEELEPLLFTPPVGQGAVAVEWADSLDVTTQTALAAALDHAPTRACLLAERAYLRVLEGGCSIPSFGLATLSEDSQTVSLRVGLVALDGSELVRAEGASPISEGSALGERLANEILANGGRELLAAMRR
jgi:hydroxymethylbilane synthase